MLYVSFRIYYYAMWKSVSNVGVARQKGNFCWTFIKNVISIFLHFSLIKRIGFSAHQKNGKTTKSRKVEWGEGEKLLCIIYRALKIQNSKAKFLSAGPCAFDIETLPSRNARRRRNPKNHATFAFRWRSTFHLIDGVMNEFPVHIFCSNLITFQPKFGFFPFLIQAAHKPSWTSHQKPPSFFCSQGSAKYLSVFGKVPQTSRTLFFAQCERPLQCERCVSMSFIFDNAHFWGLLGPRLSGLANSNVARSTFWKGKIINAFGA